MNSKIKDTLQNISLTPNQLILVVTLYFVALFNQPLLTLAFDRLYALEPVDEIFIATIPVLLFALLTIVFSLFSIKYIIKPVLVLLTIVSSLIYYATTTYGVVVDYEMMVNVVETDNAEAFAYLNINFILFFLFTGILPALAIALVKIRYNSFFREILQRIILCLSAVGVILFIAYLYYSDYASFARGNRDLRKYAVPLQVMDASYKIVRDRYFTEPKTFEVLDHKPTIASSDNEQKNVVILVVGETARAMNFTYNGYERDTNEFTREHQPISFQQVAACGTATAVSVPCMFSLLKRTEFDKSDATYQQNFLDIAKLAGADVLWIDNNSGCKDTCTRIETIMLSKDKGHQQCDGSYCYDEILIEPLKAKLEHLTHQTTLVVLHMIGSHGPTYYRRYPREYAKFLPDCQQSDIQNCSQEALINTYDNTLVYSDYVLAKIIEELGTLPENITSSMLYVSDHGESLGESGAYLHGFPYAFAPREQIDIPMLFWASENDNSFDKNCLSRNAVSEQYSHDNLFASMLGLLKIKSTAYQAKDDIFNACPSDK